MSSNQAVNQDGTFLVRQQTMTEQNVPLHGIQLYSERSWKEYVNGLKTKEFPVTVPLSDNEDSDAVTFSNLDSYMASITVTPITEQQAEIITGLKLNEFGTFFRPTAQ